MISGFNNSEELTGFFGVPIPQEKKDNKECNECKTQGSATRKPCEKVEGKKQNQPSNDRNFFDRFQSHEILSFLYIVAIIYGPSIYFMIDFQYTWQDFLQNILYIQNINTDLIFTLVIRCLFWLTWQMAWICIGAAIVCKIDNPVIFNLLISVCFSAIFFPIILSPALTYYTFGFSFELLGMHLMECFIFIFTYFELHTSTMVGDYYLCTYWALFLNAIAIICVVF